MKLSRKKLIKLIKEAMYDPRTLPKDHIPTSMIAMDDEYKDIIHQISSTGEESYNQAAALAEPPAVIDMAGGYQGALKKGDRMRIRDLFDPMINKDKSQLRAIGFQYIKDLGLTGYDYDGYGPQFRFQAAALGCEPENLAFVDNESMPGDIDYGVYQKILNMMRAGKPKLIPIPDDIGNYGNNSLYNLNGLKILTTAQMGGYYTITICG
tara:strand:- start:808 stop:1434 length:627 start_codon:yes stop_codon:yes gene_type:complete